MIQCNITVISSNIPGEPGNLSYFTSFVEQTWDLVLNRLTQEHDVKIPKKITPIYETDNEGNDIQVGFCVQRWTESDIKTKKSVWEQKWISFRKIEYKPITLHKLITFKEPLVKTKELMTL